MWEWIKRVFFGYTPPPAEPPRTELERLDAENIALGQQIDAIRAKRKALVARAAELRSS